MDGWLISRPAGPVPDATGWPGQQGKEPNIQSFLGHKESDGGEGTEADEREREILRERRDGVIWVDRCVCLQCLSSSSSSCMFATIFLRLIWFLLVGFCCFFFLFRFGICLLSQEVICLSPFRRVPNWVAAPIARCSGQIGV